jgi:dihydroxyacetone kinase
MKRRGRSDEGRKTMLDALGPTIREMIICANERKSISETIKRAAESAYKGSLATCNMIAGHGRARKLGESALGIPDPGSVSIYIIFAAMDEYINGTEHQEFKY